MALATFAESILNQTGRAMPCRHHAIKAGVTYHFTQRGVAREPTFRAPEEFAYYRWALHEAVLRSGCAVHAYALMTNHVHILMTPAQDDGFVRLTQSLGGRYGRYFNRRHRREGPLWSARFHAEMLTDISYFFTCSRYIEMNPVIVGLARDPADYEWSSHRHNASGIDDPLITPHAAYNGLGACRGTRCMAYRALFASPLTELSIGVVGAGMAAAPILAPPPYKLPHPAIERNDDLTSADSAQESNAPSP